MIIEQRTYTLKPGRIPDYLALYEAEGLALQTRDLGPPIGYYFSETGQLNQVLHMWRYDDPNDRQQRRSALYADPDWMPVVTKLLAMIENMESRLLLPAAFFSPPAVNGLGKHTD